ncbi:hypothetical protein RHS01_08601 [Rhizoctonia solani]|uniref:Uncharacterized protein n=1 Tax=Rhizoctonia solani TaxID=456999 RepID=A0A8H7LZ47_9AGAM|nr:hypothetical protein RHS01_08601 [Rhizoctonia solani]
MELEASKPILDNIDGLGNIFDVGLGFNPRFLDFFELLLEVLDLAEEAKEKAGDPLKGDFPKFDRGG